MKQESQKELPRSETHGAAAAVALTPEGTRLAEDDAAPEIDDRGTDQSEAAQILKNIRDEVFDSSDEKLALALGRPTEEIAEWTSGAGTIDGDVLMKARALALERGMEIE